MRKRLGMVAAVAMLAPGAALAGEIDGASLGLGWAVPFAGLLLTIAIGQAAFPKFWEHHFGKVTLGWVLATLVPLALVAGGGTTMAATAHLLALDYVPFVISIFTLYVIAGGIHIRTRMSGHPAENVTLLAFGTVAAGVMGTPGATLLFLPIVLASNRWRRHRTHTMVFLIFLVANMGGGLTPLGPPLLMGYLKGVSFGWTMQAMLLPTALGSAILLGLYWLLDTFLIFPGEDAVQRAAHREANDSVLVQGGTNVVLLGAVILAVVLCGNWDISAALTIGSLEIPVPDIVRLLVMILLAEISLHRTPKHIREANHFGWGPMKEVAILFAGIFITMLPPLAILKAGTDGAMGGLIRMVSDDAGQPLNWAYFVITGLLSSFLDNAPTFLVFFNVAGGEPATLMGAQAVTLTAISAGAAFWGGVTYIGNAPNFMVKSIAEERGTKMPSFFGFMLWSGAILLPTFGLMAVLLFGGPLWMLGGLVVLPAAGLAYARFRFARAAQPA